MPNSNKYRVASIHKYLLVSLSIFFGVLVFAKSSFVQASVLGDLAATLPVRSFVKMPANTSLSSLTMGYSLFYWSDSGVWNPVNKKVQWIGAGGTCCSSGQYYLVTYTEATDEWSITTAPFIGSGHAYDGNAINTGSGLHYFGRMGDRYVHTWNGSTWGTLPVWPYSDSDITPALAWFPEANGGNGGLFWKGAGSRLTWYNGSQWTTLPDLALSGYNQFIEYNPVRKVLWLGVGVKSFKVDAQLNVTALNDAPFNLEMGSAIHAVDPVSGMYIVLNLLSPAWWQFDIVNDQWTQLTNLQGAPAIGYGMLVPISDHGVMLYYKHDATGSGREAYLYRHTQGTPSLDTQAPTIPTNLSATAISSSQINLSWTASTDNVGVTGYRLERCQGSACTTFAQISTPAVTSYNDTGLTANTTYRYQVRATDAAGNLSSYSSIASVTTQATTPPSGSQVTSLQLTSAISGTLPFTIGLGFKKGDIAGYLALDIPDQQVIVKRRWNDGSVKHAIASGHVALSANTPKTINVLNSASAPSGTNLTATNIQAANPSATVQLGSIGTVNLSSLLSNPFRTWISGPEMVEVHYRSNVGSDPTLGVWFYVRLYKNGRVWIRAIVENGYTNVTISDKSYVPTVTIGGTIIYNNGGASLTHYARARWTAEGWIGGNPAITPKHDTEYLINTKLVPNYWKKNPSSTALNNLVQTYTPMSNGGLTAYMPGPGFHKDIGLLPLWDALYVTSGDSRAYNSVLANSSSMSSYASAIARNPSTKLISKPTEYPTYALNTYSLGAGPYTWDIAHNPSEGYLAYLISGDYFHYETMLINSALIYLCLNPSGRGVGLDKVLLSETRGTAWSYRTLSQLAAIFPEGDAVATEYQTLLANNMAHWKTVANGLQGINVTGYLYEYGVSSLPGMAKPWMHHFWMQSMGMGTDIEPLPSMTVWNEVRDWLYQGVVGILGEASGYCFNYASTYVVALKGAGGSEDPATWYPNWPTVFTESLSLGYIENYDGCSTSLKGESSGHPTLASTGYWGNLLPAIAYAVDQSASGASTSWSRLTGAPNWSDVENSGFNDVPIWGIVPRTPSSPPPPDTTPPSPPQNVSVS